MKNEVYKAINGVIGAIGLFATSLITYPIGTMQQRLAFEIVGTVAFAFLFVFDMYMVISRKKVTRYEVLLIVCIILLGVAVSLRLLSTITGCYAWPTCS